MPIELWAEHYERCVADMGDFTEQSFGTNKTCQYGHWTELRYSLAAGWSQVLFWYEKPQKDIEILRITYHDSALSALLDHSIFPPGARVYFV